MSTKLRIDAPKAGPRVRTQMRRMLQLPMVPEFRKHRPREGTMWHTRALGCVPRGNHVFRIDIALFHRGPVALVPDGFGYRRKRLDPRRYPVCVDGRYFIGYFPNAQSERPWRPEVKWLLDLPSGGFEIAATVWCARGERCELDTSFDWHLPWPHDWGWIDCVTAAGWVFCTTEDECAMVAPQ